MRWVVLALFAVACRSGFATRDPGLNGEGLMVSPDGFLVFEDGRYDATSGMPDGYAVAWSGYPEGDRSVHLMFATVTENGGIAVEPRVIEILTAQPSFVRLWSGASTYLLVYGVPGEVVFLALDAEGVLVSRTVERGIAYTGLEIAATPTGFAGTYTATANVNIRMFDARGVATGPAILVEAATAPVDPGIVWTGTEFVVVWIDSTSGSPRIWHRNVDVAGQPLASARALYDVGMKQGKVYATSDDAGGFFAAWDSSSAFPENLMRFASDGTPIWSAPIVVYDEPIHHDTIDIASRNGRVGLSWVTEIDTLLTNVEFASVSDETVMPPPRLLSDPAYTFCYPEVAVGKNGFGTAFAGHVEGSLGLFLAIVRD